MLPFTIVKHQSAYAVCRADGVGGMEKIWQGGGWTNFLETRDIR